MSADGTDGARPHVRSLARGLAVIRAFDAEHPRRSLSEVARATGLSSAAARRFLLTLADLGYVTVDDRRFELTPRVLELGYAYLSSLSLPELSQPHLERVVATTHESSSVSVLDGPDIVYVARVAMSRIMTVAINVGTRFPAHPTSMGRVLLAGLSDADLDHHLASHELTAVTDRTITDADQLRRELLRVREQGFAIVDQELEAGLRSIAVPIRDVAGRVVAAANISTHTSRVPEEEVTGRLLPVLLEAAGRIEVDLALADRPASLVRDAGL